MIIIVPTFITYLPWAQWIRELELDTSENLTQNLTYVKLSENNVSLVL